MFAFNILYGPGVDSGKQLPHAVGGGRSSTPQRWTQPHIVGPVTLDGQVKGQMFGQAPYQIPLLLQNASGLQQPLQCSVHRSVVGVRSNSYHRWS